MARSKNVDSCISEHDPALRQIAEALRNIILGADPELKESVKWGNPSYAKKGNICYLAATERYVNLGFFNATSLSDPQGRLEGTGKKMRHIKVRALEDIDPAQFASWVTEAAALDAQSAK